MMSEEAAAPRLDHIVVRSFLDLVYRFRETDDSDSGACKFQHATGVSVTAVAHNGA